MLQFVLRNQYLTISNRKNRQTPAGAPKTRLPTSTTLFSARKKYTNDTTAKPRNGAAAGTRKYGESRAAWQDPALPNSLEELTADFAKNIYKYQGLSQSSLPSSIIFIHILKCLSETKKKELDDEWTKNKWALQNCQDEWLEFKVQTMQRLG